MRFSEYAVRQRLVSLWLRMVLRSARRPASGVTERQIVQYALFSKPKAPLSIAFRVCLFPVGPQMIDELHGQVAADALIDNVVGARSVDGVEIPPAVVVEEIVDSDADFSEAVAEQSLAQIEVAKQRFIVERSGDTFLLAV